MAQNRLSRDEVLQVVRQFRAGEFGTEEELSAKLKLIERSFPGISDLLFHDKRELSPDEILEEAEKIKPILL